MAASEVYNQFRQLLNQHLDERVDEASRDRLALLVLGSIHAKSAAPAQIAKALETLGLSDAKAESIERRIRRIENDPELSAALCFHPLARQRLLWGRPQELLLILDPTTQEDHIVMVSVAVWYRGRALPLAWAVWPANTPLISPGLWRRIEALLQMVADLLPVGVPITWLADRAFGAPAFIDLLKVYGWHYVVRVQDHTVYRDSRGTKRPAKAWVKRGERIKRRGWAFKKRGWRAVSWMVYWGRRYEGPLCLVSDLPTRWAWLYLYRRRYPIEATFRDYKSHGWHWEQGQVRELAHVERLLVGMALATWIALWTGTQVAAELLAQPPTGRRRTLPWEGKQSLFSLGLQRLACMLSGRHPVHFLWRFADWDAPNWQSQIYFHHARAFVFARRSTL